MNTKQLKYVLVLAREQNFSRAAEILNISQPSLSQYIKKIEMQMGAELFVRANGYVRLTDAGRVVVETSRKILDLEHRMENDLQDISEYRTGSLIVGTAPYRSAGLMPAAVRAFREAYPGIQVIVREGTTAELLEAAERGEFDLCLTTMPVDERVFACEPIMTEELILAVPAGTAFEKQLTAAAVPVGGRKYPAVDVGMIDGQDFVMLTESQVMQQNLQYVCGQYDLHLNASAVVRSLDALIAMTRENVGAALVPTGIERIGGEEKISYFSFIQKLPERQVAAIYRKDVPLSKTTKYFIEVMRKLYG